MARVSDHSKVTATAIATTATSSTITEVSIRGALPGDGDLARALGEPDRAEARAAPTMNR